MPKYVVFLPDKDIIEAAHHYGFGCKQVFSKILTWFGSHIETALEVCKDDLCGKRPGAFLQDATIIWVKMIARPFIHTAEKAFIFAQCNTFNSVLQSVMHRFANTRVISLYFPDDPNLFDAMDLLSSNRCTLFWRELNRFIQCSDEEDAKNKLHMEQLAAERSDQLRREGIQKKSIDHVRHRDFKHDNIKRYSLEHAFHTFKKH